MDIRPGGVLGIDASTNTIAFAYMNNEGHLEWWGEFDLGKGKDLYTRMGQAYTNIDNLLNVILSDTDDVRCVIESAVRINNIKTTINLAYMYGIIMGAVIARGLSIQEVSPITWQNYIGNKSPTAEEKKMIADAFPGRRPSYIKNEIRKYRKQKTIEWVKETFDKDIKSDNVADAIGVMYWGFYHGKTI